MYTIKQLPVLCFKHYLFADQTKINMNVYLHKDSNNDILVKVV